MTFWSVKNKESTTHCQIDDAYPIAFCLKDLAGTMSLYDYSESNDFMLFMTG
jgi:hypothetical protein